MPPETKVISCPACNHLLRVPHEWLGQTVQCPECRAMFKAPSRIGDSLTTGELISHPQATSGAARKRLDVMLLLPAFGLMLCGFVATVVNGVTIATLFFTPDGGRSQARVVVESVYRDGWLGPPDTQVQKDREDQSVELVLKMERWMIPACFLMSLGEFLGGLSIAMHWNYRLAQIGCLLASINIAHCCCLPGMIVGGWGLLMITSQEGRGHFR